MSKFELRRQNTFLEILWNIVIRKKIWPGRTPICKNFGQKPFLKGQKVVKWPTLKWIQRNTLVKIFSSEIFWRKLCFHGPWASKTFSYDPLECFWYLANVFKWKIQPSTGVWNLFLLEKISWILHISTSLFWTETCFLIYIFEGICSFSLDNIDPDIILFR